MDRYKLTPTERPEIPDVEYENPKTGERITVPQGVRPGFGQRNWDSAVREVYEQRLAAARPEVRRAVKTGTPEARLQPRTDRAMEEPLKAAMDTPLYRENLHPTAIGTPILSDRRFYAGLPDTVARSLQREMDALGVREHEYLTGLDRWGITVIPRKTDYDREHVGLRKMQWERLRDGYAIHTHVVGIPFSDTDILRSIQHGFAGIVVTGPSADGSMYEFLILRPENGWPSRARFKAIFEEQQAHVAAAVAERADIADLTVEEVEWLVRDETWRWLEKRGIVRYRRRRK